MSRDPASDRTSRIPELQDINIPDVVNILPQKYSLRWLVTGLYRRLMPGFPTYKCFTNRHFYSTSDVVITIGGDTFTDDYGSPRHDFRELTFARSQGALTVIWAASIGPFHNKRLERKWAQQLRKVHLITVREPTSLHYLAGLGIKDNVRLVADPAFLLETDSKGTSQLGLCKSSRIVGVGMSALISRYDSTREKYLRAFAAFGREVLSDRKSKLVLIPHVFEKTPSHDDESVCKLLAERLDSRDRVTIIGAGFSASQIKHVIGQCDYFIGARTHTTIASLSSCVPTLSIAYSRKAYGINKLIFDHTDYVLPIAELDEALLMAKFDLLRDNRDKIAHQLAQQLPKVKRMANRGGEYLAEVLHRYGHKIGRSCTR